MKRGLIIGLIVLAVLALIIGGFFLFNFNPEIMYNKVSSNNPNNYTWDMTTIFFKDFKAIMNKDWQEFENSTPTHSTIIYIPSETNLNDLNAEIISIAVTYLGENYNYTLENLLEQGVESSKLIMPDFSLVSSEDWENNNFSGKKIKFTGTSGDVKREFTQVFGIKYNDIYVITYSCPMENCKSYDIYDYLVETFEPVKETRPKNKTFLKYIL